MPHVFGDSNACECKRLGQMPCGCTVAWTSWPTGLPRYIDDYAVRDIGHNRIREQTRVPVATPYGLVVAILRHWSIFWQQLKDDRTVIMTTGISVRALWRARPLKDLSNLNRSSVRYLNRGRQIVFSILR